MERAGKSLAKLKLSNAISPEQLACAAWATAVGKRIASHATAKSLVRDTLIIEVEDAVWQKQLFHLRYQIMPKLIDMLGDGIVRNVEFRVATPRRPPQTAETVAPAASLDEADRIEDRGMRIVYRQARKKASA